MSINILLFNFVFYLVTFSFYHQAKQEPSSSPGYGFFIMCFWAIALLALVVMVQKKLIQPRTVADKIGIVTATPILCLVLFGISAALNDSIQSEWYFDQDHHRYKVNTFDYSGSAKTKRIEYYKSMHTVNPNDPFAEISEWVKDSTWVYFSKSGDTTKIVKYEDGEKSK